MVCNVLNSETIMITWYWLLGIDYLVRSRQCSELLTADFSFFEAKKNQIENKNMEFCTAPQMIPSSEMTPCGPQVIPPENEEWHGVCSSGQDYNFYSKQKQTMSDYILSRYNSHDKLISSSDRL